MVGVVPFWNQWICLCFAHIKCRSNTSLLFLYRYNYRFLSNIIHIHVVLIVRHLAKQKYNMKPCVDCRHEFDFKILPQSNSTGQSVNPAVENIQPPGCPLGNTPCEWVKILHKLPLRYHYGTVTESECRLKDKPRSCWAVCLRCMVLSNVHTKCENPVMQDRYDLFIYLFTASYDVHNSPLIDSCPGVFYMLGDDSPDIHGTNSFTWHSSHGIHTLQCWKPGFTPYNFGSSRDRTPNLLTTRPTCYHSATAICWLVKAY